MKINLIEPMFMEEDQFMKIFLANVFRLYSIEKNNSDAGSNFRRAAYDANVSLNAFMRKGPELFDPLEELSYLSTIFELQECLEKVIKAYMILAGKDEDESIEVVMESKNLVEGIKRRFKQVWPKNLVIS